MKLCNLLLAMSVLTALVGVSWGGNPPERQWIKQETKDKWGDVSGYSYAQITTVDGSTEKGGIGKWYLGLGYFGDEKIVMSINPISSSIPRFVLVYVALGGVDGVDVSLRDEQKNTTDFSWGFFTRV